MSDGPPAGRPRLVRSPRAADITRTRARVLASLRRSLDARGLIEADVPVLLPSAGQEAHLHPPRVSVRDLGDRWFLQTSPELCLKRLVCAGLPSVYSLGPAFRGGREEISLQHQPEFTMLEWYRPGRLIDDLVGDVLEWATAAATALGVPAPEPVRVMTLRQACSSWGGVGIDPLLVYDPLLMPY